MAASASRVPVSLAPPLRRRSLVSVDAFAQGRRPLRNAAAQERLDDDLRLATAIAVLACCAGAGLAIGLNWDSLLAAVRGLSFGALFHWLP